MLRIRKTKRSFKKSEKGMAVIESIPVLFMMVLIFNFSLGFFGAIHSGVLNSIGSYNYALETFRFRSNLMYFRPGGGVQNYRHAHNRVHGTLRDGSQADLDEDREKWTATVRSVTFNFQPGDMANRLNLLGGEATRHYGGREEARNIWGAKSDYEPSEGTPIQTPRIWIKTVYGICISADCGESL